MNDTVSAHSPIDDFVVRDVGEPHRDLLDSPSTRLWVALDDVDDPGKSLSSVDATFDGFVRTRLGPSPQQFDWPDRLEVGDCWVRESYRGSGLADDLVARAMQYAREEGCVELSLGVEADNERAMAYYEKLGFEPHHQRIAVPLDDVEV